MTELAWVCLGAAIGAPARYLLDRAVQSRHTTGMPWGTVTVNLIGALLLGFLLGLDVSPGLQIGLCGTFTTYSTFSLVTVQLLEERAYRRSAVVVGVHLVLGLVAVALGFAAGDVLATR
jgi:CrcB protein